MANRLQPPQTDPLAQIHATGDAIERDDERRKKQQQVGCAAAAIGGALLTGALWLGGCFNSHYTNQHANVAPTTDNSSAKTDTSRSEPSRIINPMPSLDSDPAILYQDSWRGVSRFTLTNSDLRPNYAVSLDIPADYSRNGRDTSYLFPNETLARQAITLFELLERYDANHRTLRAPVTNVAQMRWTGEHIDAYFQEMHELSEDQQDIYQDATTAHTIDQTGYNSLSARVGGETLDNVKNGAYHRALGDE